MNCDDNVDDTVVVDDDIDVEVIAAIILTDGVIRAMGQQLGRK